MPMLPSVWPRTPPTWDTYDSAAALLAVLGALAEEDGDDALIQQLQWRLQAFLRWCMRWLSPQPDGASDLRAVTIAWRKASLLDALPVSEQTWCRDQAVIECTNLWNVAGEKLKALGPEAYELIELVALSPEGAACM